MSRQGVPLTLTPPAELGGNVTVQSPVNNLLYSGKIDYHITDKHLLTARYAVDRLRQANVIVQTGTNITPDGLTSSTLNNVNLNVGLVSSLTSTITNEARFVFTRFITTTSDATTAPGIIHTDLGNATTGADFCCPQGGLQKRYQYIDNLTWTHGNHTWKTGFNISYYPWNPLPAISLWTIHCQRDWNTNRSVRSDQFNDCVWPRRSHIQGQYLRLLPAGYVEDHPQANNERRHCVMTLKLAHSKAARSPAPTAHASRATV